MSKISILEFELIGSPFDISVLALNIPYFSTHVVGTHEAVLMCTLNMFSRKTVKTNNYIFRLKKRLIYVDLCDMHKTLS